MATAKRFSFVRFSLRSLFVLMTVICVFMGYELEWIRRRRAFLDEQVPLLIELEETQSRESHLRMAYLGGPRAPHLLWMFNESGVDLLEFVVEDGVVERENG